MSAKKQLEFEGMGRPNPFSNKKGQDPRGEEIKFMLSEIEDWLTTDAARNFDSEFVEAMQKHFERVGYLSDGQYNAIKNIWSKWVNCEDPYETYY